VKKLIVVLVLALNYSVSGIAQQLPFSKNEKLVYNASYNMSGLMTSFAEVTMQTSEVKTEKSSLYKLKCTAKTYSKWDSFFKIRDLFESYINPRNMSPLLYKRDTDEGGHKRYEKYTFNHKKQRVKTIYRNRRGENTKTLTLNSGTKDLVSTLYYVRSLPVAQAKNGDAKTFKILFDREEKFVKLTFLGKETIDSKLGKKACYKIAVNVTNEKLLKGTNQNIIWLTADKHKIPLQIKFSIAVGTGYLKIKTAAGLN
jgi:hypothetical protein